MSRHKPLAFTVLFFSHQALYEKVKGTEGTHVIIEKSDDNVGVIYAAASNAIKSLALQRVARVLASQK
jgi:hypothetical protein